MDRCLVDLADDADTEARAREGMSPGVAERFARNPTNSKSWTNRTPEDPIDAELLCQKHI